MKNPSWLLLALGVALLVGLFLFLERKQPPHRVTAGPRTFELRVANGKLVSGPALIQVEEGEDVVLELVSDRSDELHLHGYDLHLRLRANEPAALSFNADRSGRFDYELHEADVELGALEVRPR